MAKKQSKKASARGGSANDAPPTGAGRGDADKPEGDVKRLSLAYNCERKTLTFEWVALPGHNLAWAYVHVGVSEIEDFEPTIGHEIVPVVIVPHTGGATGTSTSPLYPTEGDGDAYAYVWLLYTRAEGGMAGDCGSEGGGDRRRPKSAKKRDAAAAQSLDGLYSCSNRTLIAEWPTMTGFKRDVAFVHVGSAEIPGFSPTMPHNVVSTREFDFEGEDTIFAHAPVYPTTGDGVVFAYTWLGYTRAEGGKVAECGIIE